MNPLRKNHFFKKKALLLVDNKKVVSLPLAFSVWGDSRAVKWSRL